MPGGTFFSHTAHGNVRQGPSVLLGPSTEGKLRSCSPNWPRDAASAVMLLD